jgi:hypothetical protein
MAVLYSKESINEQIAIAHENRALLLHALDEVVKCAQVVMPSVTRRIADVHELVARVDEPVVLDGHRNRL